MNINIKAAVKPPPRPKTKRWCVPIGQYSCTTGDAELVKKYKAACKAKNLNQSELMRQLMRSVIAMSLLIMLSACGREPVQPVPVSTKPPVQENKPPVETEPEPLKICPYGGPYINCRLS